MHINILANLAKALGIDLNSIVTEKALEAALVTAHKTARGRWDIARLTSESSDVLDLQPSAGVGPDLEMVTAFTDALHTALKTEHPKIIFSCIVRKKDGLELESESVPENTIYFTQVFLSAIP